MIQSPFFLAAETALPRQLPTAGSCASLTQTSGGSDSLPYSLTPKPTVLAGDLFFPESGSRSDRTVSSHGESLKKKTRLALGSLRAIKLRDSWVGDSHWLFGFFKIQR